MQTRSILLYLFLQYLALPALAQKTDDRILFTAADRSVTAGEFIRMYKKSTEPGNKVDIDTYLEQYITFQLKVADACALGLDTTRAFKNELNGYRTQLAQNYLTDTQVKEKLLQRSYQRYLIDLNAWHILISCAENAKPEDTLAAWTKARDIRERIIQGEPFEQVARSSSDDPSARMNGGNLGYFTAFQMIMPFEDAAYSLKKGTLSDPVRTPYGYHIIKVSDRRQSRGKVLTAHIMKAVPQGTGEVELKKAEEDIRRIHKELEEGASFSELAKKYSDHKESGVSGGKLNWFGTGEIISEYAEAAFSIADTGKFSKPVRSPYGWHIIKLLEKRAPGSFDEMRSYLESRLNQSYLNSASKKSLIEKLKKEYRYKLNESSFSWFVLNTDTMIIKGVSKYDRSNLPPGSLYSFAGQTLSNRDFASFIERRGAFPGITDSLQYIKQAHDDVLGDQIIKYENSILEKKYPEFRFLMKEFHDGILLFEISGQRVWNRVQTDTTGLREYYESVKNRYLTSRMIEGKLYTLRQEGKESRLGSAYRKYSGRKDGDLLLLKKFNSKADSMLVIESGIWTESEKDFLLKITPEPGTHNVRNGTFPAILKISRIIEPEPLPFDMLKEQLIEGYQVQLENEWNGQLKAKYTVKVDNDVLADIKRTIK